MCRWKNYENRSIFSEDMDKSTCATFFETRCILYCDPRKLRQLWVSRLGLIFYVLPYCAQTLLRCVVFRMNNCFLFHWNMLLCSVDVTGIKWLVLDSSFSAMCIIVLHFQVMHFSVPHFPVPRFPIPHFADLTFWSFIFRPCVGRFWSCLVLHFPVPHFQSIHLLQWAVGWQQRRRLFVPKAEVAAYRPIDTGYVLV